MPKGTVSHARKIINAEKLLNLLQDNVLDPDAEPLNQNKLHAIKILLAKAIPDLKAVEHTGNIDGEVTHKHKVKFVSSK